MLWSFVYLVVRNLFALADADRSDIVGADCETVIPPLRRSVQIALTAHDPS